VLIARWQINARFGHKQTAIDMLTGSIGAREATIIHEWMVADLVELEKSWSALGKIDAHKKWSKDMEPYVVPGSARWEIYRVV
jgi:hypothetical protein